MIVKVEKMTIQAVGMVVVQRFNVTCALAALVVSVNSPVVNV